MSQMEIKGDLETTVWERFGMYLFCEEGTFLKRPIRSIKTFRWYDDIWLLNHEDESYNI